MLLISTMNITQKILLILYKNNMAYDSNRFINQLSKCNGTFDINELTVFGIFHIHTYFPIKSTRSWYYSNFTKFTFHCKITISIHQPIKLQIVQISKASQFHFILLNVLLAIFFLNFTNN